MEFTEDQLASEEWRPVVGLEQYYEVSSLGRVRSRARTVHAKDGRVFHRKERLLSLRPGAGGYVVVHMAVDGKSTSGFVQRLVADAFIPCEDKSLRVLHKNHIRNDNRIENLYWGTSAEERELCRGKDSDQLVMDYKPVIDSIPGEEWRSVVGFDEYLVSSKGRVMSLKTNRVLVQSKKGNGYLKVDLRKNGKTFNRHVHRLVAEAFLERPEGCDQVNHINEDKELNSVENLEWCDQKYNNAYGTGPSRRAAKWDPMKAKQKRAKPVLQYALNGSLIRRWASQTEASRELGFSTTSISSACNRRNECQYMYGVAHGYRWDFEGVDYEAA